MIDEDVRVGRKSRQQNFCGYKTEFVMTTEERIISSVRTASGEYMDGSRTREILKQKQDPRILEIEVYVDKGYFRKNRSGVREGYKCYFNMEQCKECPKNNECAKKSARKILEVGLNTSEFYEISQHQKTDEFKGKYKKRASKEAENEELKRFHELSRARWYGLVNVSKQSKIASNCNLHKIGTKTGLIKPLFHWSRTVTIAFN